MLTSEVNNNRTWSEQFVNISDYKIIISLLIHESRD